jgi:hypothetical protein
MRALRMTIVLTGLAQGPALACDEECAPGFVFDDTLATCVRVVSS